MRRDGYNPACFVLVVCCLVGMAWAQESRPLTLGGQLSFGYSGSAGKGSELSQSLFAGVNADANGYWRDPRILSFSATPNYRWDRTGQPVTSFSDNGQGVNVNVQFLSGSSIPLTFGYSWQRSNTASISGGIIPLEVSATSINKSFNVGWSFRKQAFPTFSVSYFRGSQTSSISGIEGPPSTGEHDGLGLSASYRVLGFNLTANHTQQQSKDTTPDILSLGQTAGGTSSSRSETFSVDRILPLHSNFVSHYQINQSDNSYFGSLGTLRFKVFDTQLTSNPINRLGLNAGYSYSTNDFAQRLAQALGLNNGTVINVDQAAVSAGNFQVLSTGAGKTTTYTGGVSFQAGRGLSLLGSYSHQDANFSTIQQILTDTYTAGANYGRRAWGGMMSLSYQAGIQELDYRTYGFVLPYSSVSHGLGASYSHYIGEWRTTTSLHASLNNITQLYSTGSSTNYGGNFNAQKRLWNRWNFSTMASLNKSFVPGYNRVLMYMFQGSISDRTWSFTGQQQFNNGYTVMTGGTTVVVDPTTGVLPIIPALYSTSNSTSFSASYTRRQLTLTNVFTRMGSNVDTATGVANLGYRNLQTQVQYKFRLLQVRAGFRWWTQKTTTNQLLSLDQKAWWFEISRPFRLF